MLPMTKFKLILLMFALIVFAITLFVVFFRSRRPAFLGVKRPYFAISTQNVKKVVLDNGMTVLLFKTTSTPKVLVQIAYDIGSSVEDSHERGLAHLIEHMIFKGTAKMSEVDIDAIARKYGASYNAFTSMDCTSYYFETDKNNWQPFIPVLADCMQNSRFDEQHLNSELKTVIQELRMGKDNYWKMMLDKALQAAFPANHPYHFPVIGFKEELLNLSADNLKKFYKKHYQPSHATLFIVGDFDEAEALALVKQNFEPIADEKVEVAEFPVLLPEMATQHIRMYEDVKKEQLGIYWVIPGLKAGGEVIAALAEFVLGGGEGSRLYKSLVDKHKVASSVSAMAVHFMEAGVFLVLVEPMDGKADACRKLIMQEIELLVKNGVTNQELDRAVRIKGRTFFERLQSYRDFTYVWLQSYFATRNELDVFDRVNRYAQASSSDIQAFVKAYIDPYWASQIELLPMPQRYHQMHEEIKKRSDLLDDKILSKHVRTLALEQPSYAYQVGAAQKLNFVFPKPDRELTLGNGLKVLLSKRGDVPLVSLELLFKDADYLAASREGIWVSLMMDMLMEGSKDYNKEENVAFFEDNGVAYRFDSSGAGLSLLNDNYESVFDRFLHVLINPVFPSESLVKNKNIFIDGYERSKDMPMGIMERALKGVIYKDKQYGWTFDEAIDCLKKVKAVDLYRLHMHFVCPSGVILSIAGNFDLDKMQETVTRIFEKWPSNSARRVVYPKARFTPGEHVDKYMLRDQAILALCQPSMLTIYDPDLVPVRLLNIIAFNGLGSRLYALREQTGMFYAGFGNFATGAAREPGIDYVGALLSVDKMATAEKMIRDFIKELADKGISDQEFACAKQLYLKTIIDRSSTIGALAGTFALLESLNLGFDYYNNVLQRVQTISREELNKVANRYFTADRMARIRIGRVGKE